MHQDLLCVGVASQAAGVIFIFHPCPSDSPSLQLPSSKTFPWSRHVMTDIQFTDKSYLYLRGMEQSTNSAQVFPINDISISQERSLALFWRSFTPSGCHSSPPPPEDAVG